MKTIIAALCLMLTPMILCAQTNKPIGNTKENGVVIFSQQSNVIQKNRQFIQGFFTWLDAISSNKIPLDKKGLLNYFDSHVIYTVNGKTLAFDAAHLLSRFAKLKKTYKKIDLILPAKIMVIAGNQVAVHYQIKIQNLKHQHYIDDVVVFITLKQQKIIDWRATIAHNAP